jgi:hypothetical protein
MLMRRSKRPAILLKGRGRHMLPIDRTERVFLAMAALGLVILLAAAIWVEVA